MAQFEWVHAAWLALGVEFYSKQKKNARLFDGVIGCSRKECSEEEWVSFREAKAEVLDQVISYLMVSTYAAEA